MSNVYYGVESYTGKIICHFGLLGMKWGKRRWQYPDGRFNEEGKERYFGSDSKYNSNNQPQLEKNKNGKYTKNEEYAKIISDVLPRNFNIDSIDRKTKEHYEKELGKKFLEVGDTKAKIYKVINKIDSIYNSKTEADKKLMDKILKKSYDLQDKEFGDMPPYEDFKKAMLYDDLNQGEYAINNTFINYMKEGEPYKKLYKDFRKELSNFEEKLPVGKEKIVNYMYNGQPHSVSWRERLNVLSGLEESDIKFFALYDVEYYK